MIILYIFLISTCIGYFLELGLKSLEAKRFALDQMHWRVPLLPIYGIGALYLIAIQPTFSQLPLLLKGLIYAVSLSAIEYTGGIFCELVIKKRLWDYSKKPFNIHGHVDLEHLIYWFALGVTFDQILYPAAINILS